MMAGENINIIFTNKQKRSDNMEYKAFKDMSSGQQEQIVTLIARDNYLLGKCEDFKEMTQMENTPEKKRYCTATLLFKHKDVMCRIIGAYFVLDPKDVEQLSLIEITKLYNIVQNDEHLRELLELYVSSSIVVMFDGKEVLNKFTTTLVGDCH